MLPARDRLTKLYIYTSEADMLADTNGTEYTQGVVDGSQRFEHTFFSAFPSFGEANAAMYECEIAGTGDLTGKYIRVKYCYYATSSTSTRTERWLFAGKVDKCTYDRNKTARSVTAYDKLYELRTVDISAWWTTYWAAQSANRTYAQFLTDMCAEFGVQTDWGNLYDASASIVYTAAQNIKLSGCSFVDMLHYIGQLSRYSFFMRENGKLGRTYMHNNISQTNIDSVIDATETEYGDEPLAEYAAVMAYDGADVIYTHGSGSLTWTIRDNPLLKGKTTAQIATELDALLPKLAVTAGYYPLDAEVVVSSPDVLNISYDNLTNIRTTDGNLVRKHVIGSIELWGSQLINQRIVCPSEMERGDSLSPSMSAALSEIQKMGVEMTYKVNADNVIEAVNLEASDSVKILARALDINGIVTANQNFKILLDGSMETIAGKIGGWIIDSNRLYKTYNGKTIELSSNDYSFGISTSDDDDNHVYITPSGVTTEHKLQGYSDVATGYTNAQGNEIEQATEVWEAHAEWADYVERTHSQMKDGKLILEKRTPDGDGFYFDRPWITTEVSPDALKIGGKDILRTHQSLVGGYGTAIASGANLNTATYNIVGRYWCQYSSTAAGLSNCPTKDAFMMDVFAPISATIDDESGTTTIYRTRKIMTYTGDEYIQYNYHTSAGWYYGGWRKLVTVMEQTIPSLIGTWGTAVSANANLNSATYCSVGRYYCAANSTVATLSNCPTYRAFTMTVENMLNANIAITGNWQQYIRKLHDIAGDEFVQQVATDGSGNAVYGAWQKIAKATKTKTTITPSVGSNYSDVGGCYYEVSNNLVHLHIGVQGLTANTLHTVFTMPSGYRPSSAMIVYGAGGTSYTSLAYIRVNTDGTIRVRSQDTYATGEVWYYI